MCLPWQNFEKAFPNFLAGYTYHLTLCVFPCVVNRGMGDTTGTLISLSRSGEDGGSGADGIPTMVINDEDDENTDCSVVIHDSIGQNDDSMIERDPSAENSDTLTRNFARHVNITDRVNER